MKSTVTWHVKIQSTASFKMHVSAVHLGRDFLFDQSMTDGGVFNYIHHLCRSEMTSPLTSTVYLVTSTKSISSERWVMSCEIHHSPTALPRSLFSHYPDINLALYVSVRLILPVISSYYYLVSGSNKSGSINEIAHEVSRVHVWATATAR